MMRLVVAAARPEQRSYQVPNVVSGRASGSKIRFTGYGSGSCRFLAGVAGAARPPQKHGHDDVDGHVAAASAPPPSREMLRHEPRLPPRPDAQLCKKAKGRRPVRVFGVVWMDVDDDVDEGGAASLERRTEEPPGAGAPPACASKPPSSSRRRYARSCVVTPSERSLGAREREIGAVREGGARLTISNQEQHGEEGRANGSVLST
jgi:hypothetical protein